jgi:NAD(P)H-hydrate epimerase
MTVSMGLPALPPRDPAGHKGTFGSVCVVAGCAAPPSVMLGSAVLASLGALRAGAALCMVAAPEPLLPSILAANPSATGIPLPVDSHGELMPSGVAERLDAAAARAACMAVGPGLGTGRSAQQVVLRIVAQEDARPVVLDADALNALAAAPDFARDFRCRAIVTPHPGEYARLARALALEEDPVAPERRVHAAERLAQRLGCVVVLKGHGTVVTDGAVTWVCRRGNDALAVGGSGDVLTGAVAGLVAQHHAEIGLHACACLAVEAHAGAGERWVARHGGTAGMLAEELAAEIPAVLADLRAR